MEATEADQLTLRAGLQAELESTRTAFKDLISSLPEQHWRERGPGSTWTGKQLLHHVTWALEQLPAEVESAKREKGMFNYPKFVADKGSYWIVKWEARSESRDSILARYDAAITSALASLQRVENGDWSRGARFYGEGFYSVADLFHTPAEHFSEHASVLWRG